MMVKMLMTRVWQVEVGKELFLQGSVAGADVSSGFIHTRVTQKCSNRQTFFSEKAILS